MMEIDTEKIIDWFLNHKRKLPGRDITDPYPIWISEIMAQQTRMEAVKPYYERFLKELPTIKSLALVQEDKLLKLWEGLGYYSRARNLQHAAKTIMEKYQGIFPRTYEETIQLKGIGEYTAGAILSRAYGLPYAAVDGNVLRVLTRYEANSVDISLMSTKRYYKNQLELLKPSNFGFFNESLMELGATICGPKVVKCDSCPLKNKCKSYAQNSVMMYPVKSKQKKITIYEYTCFFLLDENQHIYFEYKEEGLLKGLYSPYVVEETLSEIDAYTYLEKKGIQVKDIVSLQEQKHIFTHQVWYMKGHIVYIKDKENLMGSFYSKEEIENTIGISTCFRKFFKEIYNLLY